MATPAFHDFVVPLTVVILIVLFAFQSRGTAKVAALFGPITAVWFAAIAIPGFIWIARDPGVLWALNPAHGVAFLLHHGIIGFYTLGAVFLAVTGAEALYADLGHFGRLPDFRRPGLASSCRRWRSTTWAGRTRLRSPRAITDPFFLLYPDWAAYSDGGAGDSGDCDR